MRETIDVNGTLRSFTVVDNPAAAEGPRGLVLIFHGSRQTGEVHRRFTGNTFDRLADAGSVVVAYLDGYKGNWNDARKESYFPARLAEIDDVSFVRYLIDHFTETRGVDPERVFGVGYSNGGQMVLRLVHEAPELLAGAAVFSATMPSPEDFVVSHGAVRPIPVLLIHGTSDPVVPFEGGSMRGWAKRVFKVGGTALSMPRTAEYFARRNGLQGSPVTSRISPEASRKVWISQTEYRDAAHPPVRLLTVHGGGHTTPGPKRAPFIVGKTSSDVTAAEEVAKFFGISALAVAAR